MEPINRRTFARLAAGACAVSGAGAKEPGWAYYGGDQGATHYSPLAQISAANVGKLEVAWVHHSAGEGSRYRGSVECTPLVVDGVMYIIGADLIVQALDGATGKLLWTHTPTNVAGGGRRAAGASRGVTYWSDGKAKRVFAPVQNRIWCLDAVTGKVVDGFGEGGAIEPGLADTLVLQTAQIAQRQEDIGLPPVLLVPSQLRMLLSRFLRRAVPSLKVISNSEVPESRTIRVTAMVGAQG